MMATHDWVEYRKPKDDPRAPGWLMNKCTRCGFEYPLEETALYPKACDVEIVRRIMSR